MDPADTSPAPLERACPPWCVTSAAEHAYDEAGAWLHEGPRFGLVRTWCLDGADPVFSATLDAGDGDAGELDAEELRHLATDALDAAMWIDRQQRLGLTRVGRSVVELVREAHARSAS